MESVAGTLAAFSTYAVAFLSRPLGSALFGHWGDRIGCCVTSRASCCSAPAR